MKGKESTNYLQTDYFRSVVFLLIIGIALFAFRDQIFEETNEGDEENTTVEPQQTISNLLFSTFYSGDMGFFYDSREITLSESFEEFTLDLPDSFHSTDPPSEIAFRDEEGTTVRTRQFDPRNDDLVFSYDSDVVDHIRIRVMEGFSWGDSPVDNFEDYVDYLNENSSIQLGVTDGD